MAQEFWLMKVEPNAYRIDTRERDKTTSWEGVRNHQARNFMRDEMRVGDGVLFCASNATPSGATGLARIVNAGCPEATAWTNGHLSLPETRSAPDECPATRRRCRERGA